MDNYDWISPGARFGHWTVTGMRCFYIDPRTGNRNAQFPCRCDCGFEQNVRAYSLTKKMSSGCKSCRAKDGTPNAGRFTVGKSHVYYKGENSVQRQKLAWLSHVKSEPCSDCGHSFPSYAMEFDHVPERGKKEFGVNVTQCMSRVTLEQLQVERAKCDLVCAVCHNHRIWERSKGLPHVPLPSSHWIEAGENGISV